MSNVFDDMRQAVVNAEYTLKAADSVATRLARVLRGRLRHVEHGYLLADLKRELQDFDAHRKEWKK